MDTAGQELERIETRLRQMSTRLDRLVAKEDSNQREAQTEAELDYRRRIELARSKHAAVRGKLDAYKAANGEKWENFKGAVETAWRDWAAALKAVKH